jgi:solute carrier family 25 phosphate transporter 3
MTLGVAQYLRFALSGAICASGVHLALTPLDVAKTKIQVDSVKYQSIGSTFGKVWKEEGPATLFTGWLPTLVGNFASGAALYGATEFIRRSLSDAAGVDAIRLEVPIILISAAIASSIGAVLICPFEAVRIRTVAQPDFAPTSTDVLTKMVKEEGIGSLVNAIPIFLVRNVPYAMTKFLIFDLSTERLFETFPAAQEQLSLSLLVSLVGGILGGTAAAVVSNPADTVISELKKAKSDISPQQAVANMLERAGPSAFFVGLPLRMVFYSLVASMTFVVYDSVRFALGIGSDDLKLYLDVLGGALNNSPLS